MTDTSLQRLSIRLPCAQAEALRTAAFAARMQPAVLARQILLDAVERGRMPRPAPARDELSPESRQLISAIHATQSNLIQLDRHAIAHRPDLVQITRSGALLVVIGDKLRDMGLMLKAGGELPVNSVKIIAAAEKLNTVCKRLNSDGAEVAGADVSICLVLFQLALKNVRCT